MILLDVNVVLAAHRDDHPHHVTVRPWFDALIAGGATFTVPDVVWAAFVRISTSRRIFTVPTSLHDAFAFARAVRAQPGHTSVFPGPRLMELFEGLCSQADASGDLAADAYIAALAVEHGCEVASLDRDFARFPELRWTVPGAA